ncbi:MAG: DUF302 domain-containing protein [Chromatiaceae bacterium]|jgi:uncharacterized protein (DUF302 family)
MIYAFGVELHLPFDEAVAQVQQAIQAEGLGVVSDVDVQSIIRNKLQEEVAPWRMLGACAPGLAKRVMEAEPEAAALLPCSVIVREIKPGLTGVTFMDPEPVLALTENPAVISVAQEARAIIERVRDRLSGQHPVNLM